MKKGLIIILFSIIGIIVFTYLLGKYIHRKASSKEYYKIELNGVVDDAKTQWINNDLPSYRINNLWYFFGDFKDESIYHYISIGDSVSKKRNNDTITVYKLQNDTAISKKFCK